MTRLPATEARGKFSDILNQVAFGGDRVVLHRHGKNVAAVVPIEDLKLLEALEDRIDIAAARKALAEGGPRKTWKQLKAELKL